MDRNQLSFASNGMDGAGFALVCVVAGIFLDHRGRIDEAIARGFLNSLKSIGRLGGAAWA
jgi:hypothetical protein